MKQVHNNFQATISAAAIAIQVLCMFLKMNISATFLVAYIQAMEVFPTPVRQSGIGFCSFISQMISIGGPYTIALGATNLMVSTHLASFHLGDTPSPDSVHDHDADLPRGGHSHVLPA